MVFHEQKKIIIEHLGDSLADAALDKHEEHMVPDLRPDPRVPQGFHRRQAQGSQANDGKIKEGREKGQMEICGVIV
jgi:hypothetical protein